MGIARSTYYDCAERPTDDTAIVEAMFEVCDEFESYGYRRVDAALRQQGVVVNHKKIRRLMREHGLQPKVRRRFVTTTDSGHGWPIYPNLAQDVLPAGPNQLWVGDIAYLQIDEQHHRVALYPAARSGLLYSAFEVEGLDQIMQNSYFMQERQIKFLQGPGRESASHQIFVHLQGPDGSIFSYVNGMTVLGEKPRRPRQFPFANESLCNWGSVSADVPELRVADGRA